MKISEWVMCFRFSLRQKLHLLFKRDGEYHKDITEIDQQI